MAKPYDLVSVDAKTALTEFSTEVDAALAAGAADQWSKRFGISKTSRAIKTTYPLPVSTAGYKLRSGDDQMRMLYSKSVSITPEEWYDGGKEKAHIVEAPDFTGWASEPTRIANEANRLPNLRVASIIDANAALEFDGLALFHNSHPINVFDPGGATFDNEQTTTFADIASGAFLRLAKQRFRERLAPNGKSMGLRLTDIIAPAALEEYIRDLLENDLLIQAVTNQAGTENVGGAAGSNRHKGTVNLVVADELLQDDELILIDRNGPPPWILQDGGAPEEIVYDKDSDLYKDTGIIGVKYVLLSGAVGALPHAIERVTVS
jgi:hypothetical protein